MTIQNYWEVEIVTASKGAVSTCYLERRHSSIRWLEAVKTPGSTEKGLGETGFGGKSA